MSGDQSRGDDSTAIAGPDDKGKPSDRQVVGRLESRRVQYAKADPNIRCWRQSGRRFVMALSPGNRDKRTLETSDSKWMAPVSAQPFNWVTASSRALIASALHFWVSLSRSISSTRPSCALRTILPCFAKDAQAPTRVACLGPLSMKKA